MIFKLLLITTISTTVYGSILPLTPSDSTWEIRMRHELSPNRSSQHCSFHKSPVIGKMRQITDSIQIKSEFVHHIDLFRCSPPAGKGFGETFDNFLREEGFNCYDKETPFEQCQYYEWWSCPFPPPAESERYPPNVGSAINQDEYLYMVAHYENPQLLEGVEVTTGINFENSELTKEYQAGFLQVGRYVSYKNVIPPNSKDFVVPHICQKDCTKGIPNPINIFGVTFHAHENAKQVKLLHLRDGKEVSTIANDVHYSPQEPFRFKKLSKEIKFLPGDELKIECTYDTGSVVKIGGNTLESEMCIAFVEYYPKILDVSTCGTTMAGEEINKFFGIDVKNSKEINPVINGSLKFTDIVENFKWTDEAREEFQEIMLNGRKDSYCQH